MEKKAIKRSQIDLRKVVHLIPHEVNSCLLELSHPYDSNSEAFEDPTFLSETTIISGRGVLATSAEGFSLGTADEPFILDNWIYLDNQKILRIPEPYITYWNNGARHPKYLF